MSKSRPCSEIYSIGIHLGLCRTVFLATMWSLMAGCQVPDNSNPATPATPAVTPVIQNPEPQSEFGSSEVDTANLYDSESWKTIIPSDCKAFFDGCNNCTRVDQYGAACTRKACLNYDKPKCLDAPPSSANEDRVVAVSCENGRQFSVFFGEYQADDQRVELDDNQLVIRDQKHHTAHTLTRVPSASGSKYSNSTIEYWSKGSEAIITMAKSDHIFKCRIY